jgi:type VI secretion system protein
MTIRAGRFVFLAVLFLGTGSCAVRKNVERTRKLFGGSVDLHTHVAANANLNNPVAVEFLFVYDQKLLDMLTKTAAKDWFMNREQFRVDNPKGFDSWYWEWIPGQMVKEQKLPLKPSAKAALVFANYLVPGDNRAKLNPYKNVTINLAERAFTATQE